MKRFIGAVILLLALVLSAGAQGILGVISTGVQAAHPADPVPPEPTPLPSQADANVIEALVERLLLEQSHMPVLQLASTSIEDVRRSEDDNWATALLVPTDPDTGETLPSEPGLAILQRTASGWQVFLPNDEGWYLALHQSPDNLISPEHKTAWSEIYLAELELAPDEPFSGYLLPWAGGITRYLSQSITHDVYTPSGSAHYAFDFYTSGQMWNVYAAKSGTVWSYKDDVPTCLQYTCNTTQPYGNFIVLQDTTTEPTSYQLYLHLAQNSIPPALKQNGAPVLQGQLIGTADNTGQSWGHHLHFQVHTNPYSYWGYSVDITFADVFINGGRPRTVAEAELHPEEGAVGQPDYRSLNFVQDDPIPPTGGLLDPLEDGYEILDGRLPLSAWALDQQSGVARAQIEAFYGNQWHPVGQPFATTQTTFEWDLCANDVPLGPISLRLEVVDYANNHTPPNNSLRHGVNNTNCQPPPPTCTPNDNQVALFSEEDFSGACHLFTIGNYPQLAEVTGFELEQINSLRVGKNVVATLYTSGAYSGRRETFTADDAGFSDNLVGRLLPGSLRITSRDSTPAAPEPRLPAEDSLLVDESRLFFWQGGVNSTRYQARIFSNGEITRTAQLKQPFWPLYDLPAGAYQWQVQAVNDSGVSSGWSPLRTFSIADSQPVTIPYTATYTTLFDTIDPGWVWTGDWQISSGEQHFRSPPNALMIEPTDPGLPASGSLTSPAIYLPDEDLALAFYYRFQGETSPLWDQRHLQISTNGDPFEDVYQFREDQPGVWLRSPVIDLSGYAGTQIRVRFYLDSLDAQDNEPLSWEIDDFEIGPIEAVACGEVSDPGANPAEAQLIAVGDRIAGAICPGGDIDFYSLEISQPGTSLLFDVEAASLGSALDSYLSLYDGDGGSLLAYNDDEIPYMITDSRLGYTFTRAGRYYLGIKAWDHPQAGGPQYPYNLQISAASAAQFYTPQDGSKLSQGLTTLQVLAQDNGGLVRSVRFWWHSGDWQSGTWQPVGIDEDGSDGWSIEFDTTALADQRGLAFYALIDDRAGNKQVVAVWNISLETTGTVFLPIVSR